MQNHQRRKFLKTSVQIAGVLALGSTTNLFASYHKIKGGKMTKVSEYEAIIKVINFYLEGANKGKSEIAKRAFTQNALMHGTDKDGSVVSGSIDNLYKGLETSGEAKECKTHIDVLYVDESIASVRVIMENWHGLNFTDLHQLFKSNGEWKIVSKVYQAH